MRKYLLLTLFVFTGLLKLAAQPTLITTPPDTTATAKRRIPLWRNGGFIQLNFNQVNLSNWAGGGENSISGTALYSYFLHYKNRDSTAIWENLLNLGFGLTRLKDSGIRKNEDRIDLNSKFGKKARGKFNYTAILNFKTQFAPGYQYPNDSTVISKFMAPAFLVISAGIDYKPNNYLSIFLSPATGKGTFVLDQKLADAGAFGVDKAVVDSSGNVIQAGKHFRPEFGAYGEAKFIKEVFKNVRLQSRLTLFNNYSDKVHRNRGNIDVNWENSVNMKVNAYIAANLHTNMIYDHDISIPETKKVDGVDTKIAGSPKLQFKQALGIGFSYKF